MITIESHLLTVTIDLTSFTLLIQRNPLTNALEPDDLLTPGSIGNAISANALPHTQHISQEYGVKIKISIQSMPVYPLVSDFYC